MITFDEFKEKIIKRKEEVVAAGLNVSLSEDWEALAMCVYQNGMECTCQTGRVQCPCTKGINKAEGADECYCGMFIHAEDCTPEITVKCIGIDGMKYCTAQASGLDLKAAEDVIIPGIGGYRLVRTGLSIAIPAGFDAEVKSRSGLAVRNGISVLTGTIDRDYRGDIGVVLVNHGNDPFTVKKGDRIAQLIFRPVVRARMVEVTDLPTSERGEKGFGSTGV